MALVAMVMLIVFVSIAVLGVSTFIIEGLRHAEGRRQNVAAAFLAQAGIHQSLYYYRYRDQRGNGYFTKGQTNIDAQNFFKVDSTAADTLMVRTNVATLSNVSGVPRDLTGLRIQNATNSNTITIDRIVVTWDNASLLQQIHIAGTNYWTGSAASPVNADLSPNFTLNTTPTIYQINRLRFSASMSGATVTLQFIMTDGTTRTLTAYPASNNNNFTVKAMGKTTLSNLYRTVKADYNALTGKIFDDEEINTIIP